VRRKQNRGANKWYAIDLHLHTPASSDYQNPEASYLDILKRAEMRQLDMVGFADHNTVAGYARMYEEIEQLRLLRKLKRSLPEEDLRLREYERLLAKITVLPGFEFTATFGFHVMALFSPAKPIREIEHILLELNVPADQLDHGSVTVGASADVLTAYYAIHEAGGLSIAAHANSSNGVAMRGFSFGGQTKIAYTQDPHLHALEVTDLEKAGRYSTSSFFSGIKPEYPRRMHCIQGSDAHRLDNDPNRHNNLGIGGRVTEVSLPEPSFEALKELFESNDFARTRPRRARQSEPAYDFVHAAREEGANIVQAFHPHFSARGGHLTNIIADVCAFANTNGGTLFIGLSDDPKKDMVGVKNPTQALRQLEQEISKRISPPLTCTVDSHETGGKSVLRVLVPRGEDPPYAVDDNKIYIRDESETGLAVRDEIVNLIARRSPAEKPEALAAPAPSRRQPRQAAQSPKAQTTASRSKKDGKSENPPRTGVEVVAVDEREGVAYYTVRDLRNGSVVKNVTEKSARKLWHYALKQYAELPKEIGKAASVTWKGDLGLLKQYTQFNQTRYDLVQRVNGGHRYFFGVTEDGVHGAWRELVGGEE
jgi:hypothetical protein